ncbi:unknown [Blautia hydrogenotrophica CAG:147]|nr:unknown [Blautia hydrogenotrophica CAG:147]
MINRGQCSFCNTWIKSVIGVLNEKKYRQETLASAVKINCTAYNKEALLPVKYQLPMERAKRSDGVFETFKTMATVLRIRKTRGTVRNFR